MIPDLDPVMWAVLVPAGLLTVLLAAYCLLAPLLERVGARRFERESATLAAAESTRWAVYRRAGKFPADIPPTRVRGNDALMRALVWVTAKVLRLDRAGAGRG